MKDRQKTQAAFDALSAFVTALVDEGVLALSEARAAHRIRAENGGDDGPGRARWVLTVLRGETSERGDWGERVVLCASVYVDIPQIRYH
jgi:hypothetical protein